MDVWDDFLIVSGIAYPEDPYLYEALVDTEAERVLREQVRDTIERLREPTDVAVRAVIRYRLMSTVSAYTGALNRMMNWPVFGAMVDGIRQEVEVEEHQEFMQNLQEQIQEQEQELGLQMPLPLGPEWDPEEDPEEAEEEPEVMEEDQVVPMVEEELGGGDITDDGGIGSGYASPIHWTPPATPVYMPGPF